MTQIMSDTTDEADQEASAEAESCAQAGPTPTKCPKCGSKRVVDTGNGSGEMYSTYTRITYHYECQRCDHWFAVTREYEKAKVYQKSKDVLRQALSGEMNPHVSF